MWPSITSDAIRDLLTTMDGLFYIVNVVVPIFMLLCVCATKVIILMILLRVCGVIRAVRDYIDSRE